MLEALPQKYENVHIKKIDIVSRKSEAWAQVQRDFADENVGGIPYVRIYGPDGQFLSSSMDVENAILPYVKPGN